MRYYAGIGARDTPSVILNKMGEIANMLSHRSYCLRSGGAKGADTAFEARAKYKQIFLPWDGFNGHTASRDYIVPAPSHIFVERFHPKPSSLSENGWKFMSRNTYQVLGPNLDDPVDFVICWTKNGGIAGGTGQAMRIAESYKIPIFNLKNENAIDDFRTYLTFNTHIG